MSGASATIHGLDFTKLLVERVEDPEVAGDCAKRDLWLLLIVTTAAVWATILIRPLGATAGSVQEALSGGRSQQWGRGSGSHSRSAYLGLQLPCPPTYNIFSDSSGFVE